MARHCMEAVRRVEVASHISTDSFLKFKTADFVPVALDNITVEYVLEKPLTSLTMLLFE